MDTLVVNIDIDVNKNDIFKVDYIL